MHSTVILAAGMFPAKNSEGERLLRAAKQVVACDAAAKTYHRHFHRWPQVIIGDLDSLAISKIPLSCRIVKNDDDSINDLTKAIRFCRSEGWNDLVIVGATGLREDHTIGNIYHAMEEGVEIITDNGVYYPFDSCLSFHTAPDTGVSIFAFDPKTKMNSCGLQWPLKGVKFTNPWCATLNRVDKLGVAFIESNRKAFAFVERRKDLKRVILSLGSNLFKQDITRERFLKMAHLCLSSFVYPVDASEVIETEGIGVPKEYKDYKFLNQILLVDTDLTPRQLLDKIHYIEDCLGRVRTVRNGPRTIDIDIIDYEGVRMKTKDLTIPHPRAKKRAFVTKLLKSLGVVLEKKG